MPQAPPLQPQPRPHAPPVAFACQPRLHEDKKVVYRLQLRTARTVQMSYLQRRWGKAGTAGPRRLFQGPSVGKKQPLHFGWEPRGVDGFRSRSGRDHSSPTAAPSARLRLGL